MRTSIKIFIATLLLLTASLAYYDRELVARFRKGDYADPLSHYVDLNFRDFDQIELRSSTAVTLTVTQGGYKVLAHPQANQFLMVRMEGKRLIVSARFDDHWRGVNGPPVLFVSCPRLSSFQADAIYFVRDDSVIDRLAAIVNWMPTQITGFNEDSLAIREEHAANIVLIGNKINKLTATLGEGRSNLNGPDLTIEDSNQITLADFQVYDQSRLSIKGACIKQLNYTLADSASLMVNGAAAHYLNRH